MLSIEEYVNFFPHMLVSCFSWWWLFSCMLKCYISWMCVTVFGQSWPFLSQFTEWYYFHTFFFFFFVLTTINFTQEMETSEIHCKKGAGIDCEFGLNFLFVYRNLPYSFKRWLIRVKVGLLNFKEKYLTQEPKIWILLNIIRCFTSQKVFMLSLFLPCFLLSHQGELWYWLDTRVLMQGPYTSEVC